MRNGNDAKIQETSVPATVMSLIVIMINIVLRQSQKGKEGGPLVAGAMILTRVLRNQEREIRKSEVMIVGERNVMKYLIIMIKVGKMYEEKGQPNLKSTMIDNALSTGVIMRVEETIRKMIVTKIRK